MLNLNSPTGSGKSRPLNALTDSLKVEGGNDLPVAVEVTNPPADPPTNAKLVDIRDALAMLATQATTQDILATLLGTIKTSAAALPLPSGAASEITLQSLLKATQNAASSVWTDDSGAFYIQRQTTNADTGVTTVSYTDATGVVVTPGVGLRPFSTSGGASASSIAFESYWTAKADDLEYLTGHSLAQFSVFDTSTSPPTKVMSAWVNLSTGNTLTTPPASANIAPQANTVNVANIVEIFANALPLPDGAASEASLQDVANQLAVVGAIDDAPWSGVGNGSQVAIAKAAWLQEKAQSEALGAPADAEWSGAGGGTVVGILKKIFAGIKGVAITGVAMPAGGDGLVGWLSALYKQLTSGTSKVSLPAKTIKVYGFTASSNGSTYSWPDIKAASFINRGLTDAFIYDIADTTELNPILLPAGDSVSFQAGPGEFYSGFSLDAQGTTVSVTIERAA